MHADTSGPSAEGLAIVRFPGPLVADTAKMKGHYRIEKFDVPIEWYAEKWAKAKGTQTDELLASLFTKLQDPDLLPWSKLPGKVQLGAEALLRKQNKLWDVSEFDNGFVNVGITLFLTVLIGSQSGTNSSGSAAGTFAQLTTAQCRMCIGDSSTAFAATQTWLVAATNKFCQAMDATYPTVSGSVFTARITVTGSNANYAWNEFVIDNCGGSNATSTTQSGGSAMSRAVSAQGTKTSGQTWIPTYTMTPGN